MLLLNIDYIPGGPEFECLDSPTISSPSRGRRVVGFVRDKVKICEIGEIFVILQCSPVGLSSHYYFFV